MLFSLLVAFALTLAACGGGSSSGGSFGGGGSGIRISGVVTDGSGTAAVDPGGAKFSLLIAFADMVIEPAHAAGVDGVTVNLYQGVGCGGTLEDTYITQNGGHFVFSGLASSTTYTICIDGNAVYTVTTDTNTNVEVPGTINSGATQVQVEIEVSGTTIQGEVEDEQESVDDSASSDEQDSEEEDTEDDEEDDSVDDD